MLYDKRVENEGEAPVQLEPWRVELLAAAQYIRDHGWCQGLIGRSNGEVCLIGSLYMAKGFSLYSVIRRQRSLYDVADLYNKVTGFMDEEHVGRCEPPAQWNDSIHRTKEEVINLLESVARSK